MEPLVSACLLAAYKQKPVKRQLRRGPSMWIYVIEAKGRLFTFSSLGRAETFARRCRRLPSMQAEITEPFALQVVATRCNGSLRGPWRK